WLSVNGKRYQDGSTRTMIFKPAFLVSYLSRFMSLHPGDVISTGTPPGVGLGQKPPVYLSVGDVMELGIENLGTQRQKVVADPVWTFLWTAHDRLSWPRAWRPHAYTPKRLNVHTSTSTRNCVTDSARRTWLNPENVNRTPAVARPARNA